jgi:hypothetical protein
VAACRGIFTPHPVLSTCGRLFAADSPGEIKSGEKIAGRSGGGTAFRTHIHRPTVRLTPYRQSRPEPQASDDCVRLRVVKWDRSRTLTDRGSSCGESLKDLRKPYPRREVWTDQVPCSPNFLLAEAHGASHRPCCQVDVGASRLPLMPLCICVSARHAVQYHFRKGIFAGRHASRYLKDSWTRGDEQATVSRG